MKLTMLHRNDCPEAYSLGFSAKNNTLSITVAEEVADLFGKLLQPNHGINVAFSKDLKIPSFIPATEEIWGFGEVMHTAERRDGIVVWECLLPTKNDKTFPVRATLRQFFVYIGLVEARIQSPCPQYFAITDLGLESGQNGSGIWLNAAPAFCRWLATHLSIQDQIVTEVESAMVSAYTHLWETPSQGELLRLKVHLRPPKDISFIVPGNACDLSSGHNPDQTIEEGYSMSAHNPDSYDQQLTFLCAIARLWEFVKANP